MRKTIIALAAMFAASTSLAAQELPGQAGTGSNSTYSGELLEKYPSLDLMNSFTGVIPGLYQIENYGRTGVRFNALNCSLRIRAFSSFSYVVDGVVIPESTELQISPEEIESVRVVSDVLDKLRIGPEVATGAIYITTLRGRRNGREIKAGFEKGVDVVDRMPEWVSSGVEYATLNNLARSNAGYATRFSNYALEQFAKGDNMDPGFPSVDYRSLMFKNIRDYNKAHMLVRGGGETVQYSANLGYAGQGDIYAAGADSGYDRFNAKMNMDIRINQNLGVNFSFIGVYGVRRTPLGKYGSTAEVNEFPTMWSRAINTPPVEYPLMLGTDELTGKTIYPVSTSYPDHPYGSLLDSGFYRETTRIGITKATVNYDLSYLLKGLQSETQVSYNIFYLLRIGQASDYIGYNFNSSSWSSSTSSHKGESASSESQYKSHYLQGLQFHEKLKYNWSHGGHDLNAALTYYRSNVAYNINSSYHNQQNFIFDASYCHGGKYIAELVANYSGTSSLKPGNRYRLFPAIGLGWVASNENWASGISWLDYLKVRMQVGIIGNETYGEQFYWQSRYTKSADITFGPYSLNQWFGSNSVASKATTLERLANPGLDWEKLYEVSAGFDALLLKKLDVGATFYYTYRNGIVTDVSSVIPMFYGVTTMYDNYNATSYTGLELRASWSGKSGDFAYQVGGNALLPSSRYEKYCENVIFDNLRHVGRSTTTIFANDYIGRFESDSDIASSPKQTFDSALKVGDFKYRDVTGDGVVDSNDRTPIGDTAPKLLYSLTGHVSWRNADLTVVCTGRAFMDVMLNNAYYWNGWGDGNYSAFVRDNLESGKYPRLSYVQSQNNFRNSQFWMVDGSFFKVQNIELGYNFPFREGNKAGIDKIRVFARGANLLTLSAIKDCDPESMSAGVTDYPLFRTFTGGIRFMFK